MLHCLFPQQQQDEEEGAVLNSFRLTRLSVQPPLGTVIMVDILVLMFFAIMGLVFLSYIIYML